MTMPPGFGDGGGNGGGGGGGPTAGAPMGVYGATNQAVLQSILLAQQRCQQSLSLLQVQVDNGFSAFKVWQQQRFVTLNDNVRRFGGAIQFKGGLPGRTQCKLAIEEGPLPSRRTVHPILQMTAMPSCAPTFTPYRTYGRNAVDAVPRGRSSDAAIGSECGTLWRG